MVQYKVTGQILDAFPHEPTGDQKTAINHLSALYQTVKKNPVYILKGYAGTGKTSLISAYVNMLASHKKNFVLLAPTGRAAKVLSKYTGYRAHTIHRYIYYIITSNEGHYKISLSQNRFKDSIFIIDEASMISDNSQLSGEAFAGRNLLDDLFSFVFSRENNKIILIGDTAQLPPVGLDMSPALDIRYIKSSFNITAFEFEMQEVMRQAFNSGVLSEATSLRKLIGSSQTITSLFNTAHFKKDILKIEDGNTFEELLNDTFNHQDIENSVIVCRTNKRANLFNQQVRNNILNKESEIEGGDVLMVVKNDYFWLDETSKAGFIANGDLMQVVRILKIEEMYGFHFADAEIRLIDYPEEKEISVKILLSTIYIDGPGLPKTDRNALFQKVEEDYMDIPERRKRVQKVMTNPWYNALHVKFAYAMTCHKTQGGQWPHVFVDQGYLTEEMVNTEYLRWLYTAVTRSTSKLYLVNFDHKFFK
ncbi:MAG: AAA family ATPase [Bacteroidetes bacterium]|nr:AAA family ATPase [Bacteroidota bacterium]